MTQKSNVYILFSQKLNRFYTGFTMDFDLRIKFHQNAESRKFTFNADDWELFYSIAIGYVASKAIDPMTKIKF